MQELMVCCDELQAEELLKHRSSGSSSLGSIDLIQDPPGPLVPTHEPAPPIKGAEMVAAGQELQLGTRAEESGGERKRMPKSAHAILRRHQNVAK